MDLRTDDRERRHYDAIRAANEWERHRKANRSQDITMNIVFAVACGLWAWAIYMLLEHL